MQQHTLKALALTLVLFLVIVPALFVMFSDVSRSYSAGWFAIRRLGLAVYVASATIFWLWLSADGPLMKVPRSKMLIAIAGYFVFLVLAVAGYLLYSRGLIRGLGAVAWFALLIAAVICGLFVEALQCPLTVVATES